MIDEDLDLEDLEEEDLEEAPKSTIAKNPPNITQHTLLSYLVGNPEAWTLAEPIIKEEYFDFEYANVVGTMIKHSKEFRKIPSIPIIRMETGVLLDQYSDVGDSRITQWLLGELETFCRHQATRLEISRMISITQKDTSRATIENVLTSFKKILEINVQKDLGIEVHRDAKKLLYETADIAKMPTGYKHLDVVLNGGFPRPGLIIIPGKSGLGKSVSLMNFGVNYCKQKKFVVYITLELSEKRIFDRIGGMMTDTRVSSIDYYRDKVSEILGSRIDAEGLYVVKKMPAGTTAAHINAYLRELYIREGIKPDVLLLDYIDLLHPKTKIKLDNIHLKDKYTSEEVYSLAEEWNLLCITASQLVKQAEEKEYDHSSLAGGTPKVHYADYVIALKRKYDDPLVWMIFLKARDGGDGVRIPFNWNLETLRITDAEDELFFKQNPFYDKSKKYQDGNTYRPQRTEVNRELRSAENESILEHAMRNENIFNDLFDPLTGEVFEDEFT